MYDIILKKQVKWDAFWLHDPIFKKQPVVFPVDAKRIKSFRTELHNVHTLFRKEFEVKQIPIKSAKLYITADDCYKAYMNGAFIAYGPAQSIASSYNYNAFEIKSLIKPGINTLGIHVYYQGMLNMALVSADNLNGMICMLEITYTTNETQLIRSDSTFSCHNLKAYTFDKIYGYETQFSENIDLNLYPYNWNTTGFDDDSWEKPFISAVPHPSVYNLKAQMTPTVHFEKVYPKRVARKGKGHYLLDFEAQTCATAVINAKGEKNQVIRMWHGEELTDDKLSVRHNMRCGCDYDETITLSGNNDKAEFFDYKGFRYIEIFGYPGKFSKNSVYVMHRHYPIPKNHAVFSSDNQLFNKIWKICERGITEGTQEAYVDCVTREKGAFLGDGLITGLSHLAYTNDTRIMKKFLYDCIESAKLCPGLFSTALTYDATQLIDYSLIFPMVLNLYYDYTKDEKILFDSLTVLDGIIDYYAAFYTDKGILGQLRHVHREEQPAMLVDWPVLYRDGYTPEIMLETNCFANMLYIAILKETAKIYETVGIYNKAESLIHDADKLEKAVIDTFYIKDSGLFAISETNDYPNYHNAVFALYLDMELPNGQKPLLDYVTKRGISCGVYFTYYLFDVLYKRKMYDEIFNLMTSGNRSSWKTMIDTGQSACIEAWHPDDKINCSMCHPWSSIPMIYTDIFFGISVFDRDCDILLFKPRIPKQLKKGSYKKPGPFFDVTVSFERKDKMIKYQVDVLKDIQAVVSLSDDSDGILMTLEKGINVFEIVEN